MRHLCLDHLRQMLVQDTSICVIDCGVSLVRYTIIHIHLWMSTTEKPVRSSTSDNKERHKGKDKDM